MCGMYRETCARGTWWCGHCTVHTYTWLSWAGGFLLVYIWMFWWCRLKLFMIMDSLFSSVWNIYIYPHSQVCDCLLHSVSDASSILLFVTSAIFSTPILSRQFLASTLSGLTVSFFEGLFTVLNFIILHRPLKLKGVGSKIKLTHRSWNWSLPPTFF